MIRTTHDDNIHEVEFSVETGLAAATISGGDLTVAYERDSGRLVVSKPDTNAS
jgi:hypothetical protein